jgi:hypothetical protein
MNPKKVYFLKKSTLIILQFLKDGMFRADNEDADENRSTARGGKKIGFAIAEQSEN